MSDKYCSSPVVTWDKQKKVLSTEEWKAEQSPEHPSYVPNMSEEDASKWRGKVAGTRAVELRKHFPGEPWRSGVNVVVIVSGSVDGVPPLVSVSMNGTCRMMWPEYHEFQLAVIEAVVKLGGMTLSEVVE